MKTVTSEDKQRALEIPTTERLDLKAQDLGMIPIESIRESATNPRREFGDMAELTASIARDGILQPVLVRKLPGDGLLELICGARRLRAARAAGLAEIPARAVECSDEEALELQLVENSQRADVHPMEEALAFDALLCRLEKSHKDPLLELAARVGKTRAHVRRRLELLKLPKVAQEAFLTRKLTVEVANVIARIPDAEMREKAAQDILEGNYDGEPMSASEAAALVRSDFMLTLGKAGFDRTDETLVPGAGACGNCPKRTGVSPDLFGDVDDKDVCTDPPCFRAKSAADWERKAAAAREKGVEVLPVEKSEKLFRYGNLSHDSAFVDPKEETWVGDKRISWKKALGKEAPAPVLVRGPNGEALELWKKSAAETAFKKARPEAAKKQEAQKKQTQNYQLDRKIKDKVTPKALELMLEKASTGKHSLKVLQATSAAFLATRYGNSVQLKNLKSVQGYKNAKDLLARATDEELRLVILECSLLDYGTLDDDRVEAAAGYLEIDLKKLRSEARAELTAAAKKPTPAKGAKASQGKKVRKTTVNERRQATQGEVSP